MSEQSSSREAQFQTYVTEQNDNVNQLNARHEKDIARLTFQLDDLRTIATRNMQENERNVKNLEEQIVNLKTAAERCLQDMIVLESQNQRLASFVAEEYERRKRKVFLSKAEKRQFIERVLQDSAKKRKFDWEDIMKEDIISQRSFGGESRK